MPTEISPAPASAGCQVVELRQYTLRPGRRDELIDVFDRELVETQEAVGMKVMGQFRDLDRPDRFVWLRGFADMEARLAGLRAFYGGPVWAEHGPAANQTMREFDDVLLLRPAWPAASARLQDRRPAGPPTDSEPGFVDVTVFALREPAPPNLLALAQGPLSESLQAGGARQLAWYVTEPAANNFPRLPVREGLQVLVGVAVFDDLPSFERFAASGSWQRDAAPRLQPYLDGSPQTLRLEPTARSGLRG